MEQLFDPKLISSAPDVVNEEGFRKALKAWDEAESEGFRADDNRPNRASIHVQDTTIIEGTERARIPISLNPDEAADMKIVSLWLTVTAGGEESQDGVKVPIIANDPEAWKESIFNIHPQVWRWIRPTDQNVAGYVILAWMPPFDTIPCKGHVCYVTLDTSKLKPGVYWVKTDKGTSGTGPTTKEDYSWFALHFDHYPGALKVVPRSQQ